MIKSALRNKDTFATPIILYMTSVLGDQCLSFEPETVAEYLRSIEPATPRALIDRVHAASGLFTSNLFWQDPAVFNIVSRALNRNPFPSRAPASITDMAWGVAEATLLFGDPTDGSAPDTFSDAIIKYIRYALSAEGLFTPPEYLSFVGSIPKTPVLDSADVAMAMEQQSSYSSALIEDTVNTQMLELLSQLKQLKLPLQKTANAELDELIAEYKAALK